MDAGLTANGLVIRTQPEIEAKLRATLAAALPGINLDEGPEQQLVSILAEELAIAWETLQTLYGAAFGNGDGLLLDLFAAITGTLRRQATKSRTPVGGATVNLAPGTTLPKGKVAAVLGVPDAQFQLAADVTNGGGAPADVPAIFESVRSGPIAALAGTLTVIVTPFPGWNSVTNTLDAVPGKLIASDTELDATRIIELAGRGRRSYAAIRAAVESVANVLSAFVIGNETMATVAGRPPKSFETVVWDGGAGAATDADIAQSIYDSKPEGILAFGTTTANATTEGGAAFPIGFTRVTALRTFVAATVILAPGADPIGTFAQVAAALAAKGNAYIVAQTAYASQLVQSILDAVPGVVAVLSLTLGAAPSPTGASVVPLYSQIVRISTGDCLVGV
jgi:hypothetical protein